MEGKTNFPLKMGNVSKEVQMLQIKLGVAATGQFDQATEHALGLRNWPSEMTEEDFAVYVLDLPMSSFPLTQGRDGPSAALVQILMNKAPTGIIDLVFASELKHSFHYSQYKILVWEQLKIRL